MPDEVKLPLRTASLVLRHFTPGDAQRIMELNGETTTRRWLPSHVYAGLDEATESLGFLIAAYASPGDPRRGPYVLAVEDADSATLLGHVGFSPLGDEVEVSYAIAEHARGNGLGSEALGAACRWISQAFGVHSVLAITADANVPSRRTLARAGFTLERTDRMLFQGTQQAVRRYAWRNA